MTLYRNKYRIETTRLKSWSYSFDGYYFITICVQNREELFGEIKDSKMIINEYGKIVEDCWLDLTKHYNNIKLDEFIVMPNHVHGIIIINVETGFKPVSKKPQGKAELISVDMVQMNNDIEAGLKPVSINTKNHGLSEIVRALKTFSLRKINEIRNVTGIPVWQTRFYDHIIRDEFSLNNIRKYIMYNPLNWEKDEENPLNLK